MIKYIELANRDYNFILITYIYETKNLLAHYCFIDAYHLSSFNIKTAAMEVMLTA